MSFKALTAAGMGLKDDCVLRCDHSMTLVNAVVSVQ